MESIELWMRAYPRRWREARGQELVDVVVDLAGLGAKRLDPRAAFDLVRGGGPRDGGAPEVVLTQFWLNKPEMGPGFGWDSVAAPMGGHRVAALAILMVALGVGTLGAVAVWRRLGRLPGERGRIPGVDQHVRTLRPQPESPTLGG